ncbi:TPA: hypothetical protein N0F65_008969 [Lagenidium giganteum]|uniref:Myb-like domain-containing protein n=1 Tax=Lagenidium giganteum TaxID=4803 RepID=A0AAV2YY99_9STRA|nr:TPA: hypothetical protein N0F65_008969 [Lagenidium giganteum]
MRAALEAVADFLSKYGALEESSAIQQLLGKLGWPIEEQSDVRWRTLIAVLKQELSSAAGSRIDYVFLFERLVQLHTKIPTALSRSLFESKLILHVGEPHAYITHTHARAGVFVDAVTDVKDGILVQRFAAAFEGLDSDVFKVESDVLYRNEGVYDISMLIHDKIFGYIGHKSMGAEDDDANIRDEESSLKEFLTSFKKLFDHAEPQQQWLAFHAKHCISEVTFGRDMKRALSVIEDAALGDTLIEKRTHSPPSVSSKTISRKFLEMKFRGSADTWNALNTVYSLETSAPVAPKDQQIWAARLPFTASASDVSSPSDDDSDAQPPPQPSRAKRRRAAAPEARAKRRPQRRSGATSVQDDAVHVAMSITGGELESRPTTPVQDEVASVATTENLPAEKPLAPRRNRSKRKRWNDEEVNALMAGYALFKDEANVWMCIKRAFPEILNDRTNVDLKDKYRNLQQNRKIPKIE